MKRRNCSGVFKKARERAPQSRRFPIKRLVDALDLRRIGDTREGELRGKVFDFLLQLLESLGGSTRTGDGADKVLEELRAGLFLRLKRDLDGTVEEVGNLDHLGLLHRSRSKSVGADADTTGNDSGLVARNRVLVEGDFGEVTDLWYKRTRVGQLNGSAKRRDGKTNLLDLGTGETEGTEVPEDEVVLGTRSAELVIVLHELGGDGLRVLDDLSGVLLERRRGGLLEGDGNTSDSL